MSSDEEVGGGVFIPTSEMYKQLQQLSKDVHHLTTLLDPALTNIGREMRDLKTYVANEIAAVKVQTAKEIAELKVTLDHSLEDIAALEKWRWQSSGAVAVVVAVSEIILWILTKK